MTSLIEARGDLEYLVLLVHSTYAHEKGSEGRIKLVAFGPCWYFGLIGTNLCMVFGLGSNYVSDFIHSLDMLSFNPNPYKLWIPNSLLRLSVIKCRTELHTASPLTMNSLSPLSRPNENPDWKRACFERVPLLAFVLS